MLKHFSSHKLTHESAALSSIEGHINRGSQFGEIIYRLAKDPQFHTFLEIGTWNGRGSTQCFIGGLLERTDGYLFVSFENDERLHRAAMKYWRGRINSKILLVYGTIVRPDEIMKEEEVRTHPLFGLVKEHYRLHYQSDLRNSSSAPLAIEKIPSQIDVLLLDGGEFSGSAEWSKLKDRGLRVVLLDDVNTIKNRAAFEELTRDKKWTSVLEDKDDRNGIAVFAKRDQPIQL